MSRFELTRAVTVRAIHHLESPHLSTEENARLYGKCYRTHGHHYEVQVTLTKELEKNSDWIFSRDQLDQILLREIVEPFDGKDLNRIYPNTSCEAIALIFHERLKDKFAKGVLLRISIQETKKNYFESPPAS